MARHLRRHGLPNPDQSIKCLVQARDDRQVAIRMAKHPRSAAAFTEMMWSQRLDPTTVLRRWPTRVDHAHRITNMLRYAERTSDPFIAATQWHENVNAKSVRWVQYHAMAMEASLAWSRAWQQARKSIDDRRADWMFEALRKGDRHGKGVVTWFCRTKGRGAVFVGYIHGVDRQPFTAGMPTKQERTAKTEAIRRARQGSVEPLVKHPCLRWDNRHGWHVAQGAFPDDGDIRRKRLLHCGPRTSCWVFTSAGRFVARLDGGQIEASGETASEALNGLRRAVVQYRQTYEPHNAVQPVPSKDGDPHRAAVADAGSAKCPNPRDGVDRHGLDARAESRVGGIG